MPEGEIKARVKEYWNKNVCGVKAGKSPEYTKEYYDEIEDHRYMIEPEIFPFAQFTRFYGQKVLEVGIGPGTDFIQWVRAGARAYGVDLTEEAVRHVNKRLELYGLSAEDVRVADAEKLPYPDNNFDLVYSWGVIHHTPDTLKALKEIIRVTRNGGRIKIMVYNRASLAAFYLYIYYGLLRGRPLKSVSEILSHNLESSGTKAFTLNEIKKILAEYPVRINDISAKATKRYDLLWGRPLPLRFMAYILACLFGFGRIGWFMTIDMQKIDKEP